MGPVARRVAGVGLSAGRPGSWADADRPALRIGTDYESSLSRAERRRGAHYTPFAVARIVADLALSRTAVRRPRVLDPTCGGGVFLIAALDVLVDGGLTPEDALGLVSGVDIDPGAVAAATAAVEAWSVEHGVGATRPSPVVLDDVSAPGWSPSAPIDVVLGNPPFRGRLKSDTAMPAPLPAAGDLSSTAPYTDLAVQLWSSARRWVVNDGVVAFILPQSTLAARDAEAARAGWMSSGALSCVWAPEERLFPGADVSVVVPVVVAGASQGPVEVLSGAPQPRLSERIEVERLSAVTWAPVLAAAMGVPVIPAGGAPLEVIATATAGFRELFYAVSDVVREAPGIDVDRVATTAMIDVGTVAWGARRVRIGGRYWLHPVVEHTALMERSATVGQWVSRQRTPKVLVASQTAVIEAGVDRAGDLLPLTPIVAVIPTVSSPWEVLAALSAPPASAWAMRRAAGTGLSTNALKLSARQVLEVPAPVDTDRWRRAAADLEAGASVDEVAAELTEAWGAGPEVTEWWRRRAMSSMRRAAGAE